MRAVIQRVSHAKVEVNQEVIGSVQKGLMVLFGVGREDDESDADYLVSKIVNLRIFEDEADKMNLSLLDIQGELLVVSQFTLYGDVRKGRRPGFDQAAPPARADELYQYFVEKAKEQGIAVATGQFQAHMEVSLLNDGPVTILLDSKKVF